MDLSAPATAFLLLSFEGSDRIIWELQQVFKNFIAAMDSHLETKSVEQASPSIRTVLERALIQGG